MFSTSHKLLQDGQQGLALAPQAISGSTAVNGVVFDQLASPSCEEAMVAFANGAAAGTPTSFELAYKVQHSDDNSTWADATGLTAASAADNGLAVIAFRPGQLKRYVRGVVTPAFVGGTTPSVPVGAVLILHRSGKAPA